MADGIGIRISEKKRTDYFKLGRELLTIEKIDKFMQVRSIHYHNVVLKRLEDYSLPEWLVCVNEEVLLEYAIPIFSKVLQEYPMLSGMNNEWQVLYNITRIKQEFWEVNIGWKEYFKKIIDKIFLEYEQGEFVRSIPETYLYEFKKYCVNK